MKPESILLTVPTFPFADASDPLVNNAIGDMVRGVHKLVVTIVNRHFVQLPWHDRQDIVAEIESHLALYTAPRYDPTRGKWSTLVHRAATNRCRARLRKKKRRPRHQDMSTTGLQAGCTLHDARVQSVADSVLRDPCRFGMTGIQAQVFKAVTTAEPGTQLKDIATALGYAGQASLSTILRRIKSIITNIDVEGFDAAEFAAGRPQCTHAP